jgi:hypothetical protein
MSEWWTYTLSDFLLFSPQTYYRLFELYNAAIWPAQVVAFALGLAIWALLPRGGARQGRLIAAILAGCWLWVAIAFHLNRYATINWVAVYLAGAFGFESVLLIWTGVIRGRLVFEPGRDAIGRTGLWIFLFALLVQPLIGPLLGREWRQIEIFGVAPDPTAVATLGILSLTAGRVRWELIAVPAIWCAITGATLWAMEAPDAWVTLLAGALVVGLAVRKTLARRRGRTKGGKAMAARGAPKGVDFSVGEPCCQVLELRQYLLKPGERDRMIELFDRRFIESQEALGMRVVGQFRVREQPDLFLWIRGFPDMSARARSLEAFYGESPAWRENRDAANATMIDFSNVLLLKPAGRSRGFTLDPERRPGPEDPDSDGGVVVAEISLSEHAVNGEFVAWFETVVIPVLRRSGIVPLAHFITEAAVNTYPQLPLREGEHVFVWFAAFPDRAAYRSALTSLHAQEAWNETIAPRFAAVGRRQVIELEPTRRSLLRGH